MSDGSLPKGWATVGLGDILPLSYGKSLVEDKRDPNGQIPVYGSSGLVGLHSQVLIDRPSIIVGRKGNVGAVYFCAGPSWVIDTAYYADGFGVLNLSLMGMSLTQVSPICSMRSWKSIRAI